MAPGWSHPPRLRRRKGEHPDESESTTRLVLTLRAQAAEVLDLPGSAQRMAARLRQSVTSLRSDEPLRQFLLGLAAEMRNLANIPRRIEVLYTQLQEGHATLCAKGVGTAPPPVMELPERPPTDSHCVQCDFWPLMKP